MPFLKDYPQIKIIKKIAAKKKVSVYLVGGFLRDHSLGITKNDLDFAVEKNALSVAMQFAKEIKGAYVLLDEERGCARVAKKSNGKIFTYDFADYRAKTFKGDLSHRDFTINTLSVDIKALDEQAEISDVIRDLKGGLKDIKSKQIIMVSSKIFEEDPLRILRAYSIRASLSFRIDRNTLKQIKQDQHLLNDVSPERIREELFKIFSSENAAVVLKEMDKIGVLEVVIPQVNVMFNCSQKGVYHHLDVWPHSIETVVQLEKLFIDLEKNIDIDNYLDEKLGGDRTRLALMKLAALLHDIGKPESKKKLQGRVTFHGHENIGKKIVKYISKMLKLSIRERHALEDMVQWHLRPGYLSNFKRPSDKAVYRYFRDTRDEAVSIALLSLADQRSTRGPMTTENDQMHHEKICRKLISDYFIKKKEKPFVCLINGDDLIKKLKLKPSPIFSRILEEVAEQQVLGKINTKKEAIALAKKITGN